MSDVIQLTDNKFWDAANVMLLNELETDNDDNYINTNIFQYLKKYLPVFKNVGLMAPTPIEEACPFVNRSSIACYFINHPATLPAEYKDICLLSDFPLSNNVSTLYVICFGESTNNHLHFVFTTDGLPGTIGRMFIHGHRVSGSTVTDTWREVTPPNGELSANPISLLNYNSSTKTYTIPSPGYVVINNDASTTGILYVGFSNDATHYMQSGGIANGRWTVPVYPNMRVYVDSPATAWYYPM